MAESTITREPWHCTGRIETAAKKVPGTDFYETLLTLPALDEWSMPDLIPVRSKKPFGKVGEVVSIDSYPGGYPKRFKATDKESGEQYDVRTAQAVFRLVE